MTVNKCLGFSLLEVLWVLSMATILLVTTTWGLRSLWVNNHLLAYQHDIMSELTVARHYAMLSNQSVIFCGSSNHKTCDGKWTTGQLIKLHNKPQIIRVYPALSKGFQLHWYGGFSHSQALIFNAHGKTQGQQGRFILSKGTHKLALVITRHGRVRPT